MADLFKQNPRNFYLMRNQQAAGTGITAVIPESSPWKTVSLQWDGLSGDTLVFEGSMDAINWTVLDTIAATPVKGIREYAMVPYIRARLTTWASGNVTVRARLVGLTAA